MTEYNNFVQVHFVIHDKINEYMDILFVTSATSNEHGEVASTALEQIQFALL